MNNVANPVPKETSVQTVDEPKYSQGCQGEQAIVRTKVNWMITPLEQCPAGGQARVLIQTGASEDCDQIAADIFDLVASYGVGIEESSKYRPGNVAHASTHVVSADASAIERLVDAIDRNRDDVIEGVRPLGGKLYNLRTIGGYTVRFAVGLFAVLRRSGIGVRNHQIIRCSPPRRHASDRDSMDGARDFSLVSIAMRIEVPPECERRMDSVIDEIRRLDHQSELNIRCGPVA